MATCETCGNSYDKSFQVVMNGKSHTFDSFECAIFALAPTCKRCGTRIVRSQENYPAFPPALLRDYDVVEIRRTWHFDTAVRLY